MPNILIVAYRFPPDSGVGAKRAHRIASHLAGRGWGVQVLTVRPGYYEGLDPTLLGANPGFEVVRTHALTPKAWGRGLRTALGGKPIEDAPPAGASSGPAPRMSMMERLSRTWDLLFSLPDEWSGWIPPALAAGLTRARRVDLILATGPPFSGIVVAAVLARAGHRPLVLDYRDPWTTFPSANGRPRWRRNLERSLETRCLRRAALIVTTTKAIADDLSGLGATRTAVVPNSFDPKIMQGVEPTRFSRFTVVYAGNVYGDRSIEPVLRAMSLMRTSGTLPQAGMAVRVLGAIGSEVTSMADRLRPGGDLEIEGFLPHRQALARMKGADVLLLVVGSSHAAMVPAKLYEYLAARRFILALAPRGSEAGRIVTETGSGEVVEPEDIAGIGRLLAARLATQCRDLPPCPGLTAYESSTTMPELERLLLNVVRPG